MKYVQDRVVRATESKQLHQIRVLYKDNIFWPRSFTMVSIFIFAMTSHVNHWTSLDPASSRDQANSKWKT